MTEKHVVLLHGFTSSGKSAKARYLRHKFESLSEVSFTAFDFNPTRKDFEYLTVTGMIDRLRQYLLDHEVEQPYLIGSSLGGLVALRYARRYGAERLLLLAPLLAYRSLGMSEEVLEWWRKQGRIKMEHYAFAERVPLRYAFHRDGLEYREQVEPPAPLMIIHGRDDAVISIEKSREYAAKYEGRVELVEVDSDHRLHDQLDTIWERVRTFLLA